MIQEIVYCAFLVHILIGNCSGSKIVGGIPVTEKEITSMVSRYKPKDLKFPGLASWLDIIFPLECMARSEGTNFRVRSLILS